MTATVTDRPMSPLTRARKSALACGLRQAVWELGTEQEDDPRLNDELALIIGIALQDLKKIVERWRNRRG